MGEHSHRKAVTKARSPHGDETRVLFELNPAPMMVCGHGSLRFLDVNRAALSLYQYPRLEFLKMTALDIRPEEDHGRLQRFLGKAPGDGVMRAGLWRHRRRDGALLDVEIALSPIRYRQHRAYLVMVRDVTAEKAAVEALRISESRFRTVADFTYDWETWSDPQGRFVYVSPSCQRITGWHRSDLMHNPGLRREMIHPDDRGLYDWHVRECELKQKPNECEWRIVHPDGEVTWVAHGCQPVFDEEGRYLGVRASNRNITQRKQAEAALMDLTEKLEQRVIRRTAELTEQIRQREEVERHVLEISEREQRRIGQDLHDSVGQHLAAVKFMSSALALSLRRSGSPGVRRAERIGRELEKTSHDLRAICHGLQPVQPDGQGLRWALRDLAGNTRKLFRIPCRFTCRGQVLVTDYAVATHLFRIAQEAVTNATRHGKPRHIRITLQSTREGIQLRIANDGQKMDARGKKSRGLGLNIMKYRASVIHAALTVDSGERRGVTITCTWHPDASPETKSPS
jgi:PAS domain S-box-containing protein